MRTAFMSYKLNEEGRRKMGDIEAAFNQLVDTVQFISNPSREHSLMMTKLEEACFYAKKSVAQQSENQEHD